jgi:hypothetical protein
MTACKDKYTIEVWLQFGGAPEREVNAWVNLARHKLAASILVDTLFSAMIPCTCIGDSPSLPNTTNQHPSIASCFVFMPALQPPRRARKYRDGNGRGSWLQMRMLVVMQ